MTNIIRLGGPRIPSLSSARAKDPRKRPPIAKLTAPTIGRAYLRARLFKHLDQARRRASLLWVSAPAGAGKTTLVGSYVRARTLPTLWYHVDEGDNDPTSFFYYLGLGAQQVAPRRRRLPALTPEYLGGLQTYGRNFFRALFERMQAPGMLVLDNFETLAPDMPLQEILAAALHQTPPGMTVMILSRADPPAPFARWRACDNFALTGWEALRLQPDEALGICRLCCENGTFDEAVARRWHEQSEGWAAGLMLLLKQASAPDESGAAGNPDTCTAVFDYFAGEVLRQSPPAQQEFLLQTALLPQIEPASARSLTDNSGAESILAELAHKNYFTTRLADGSYRYHALFREFLLARGRDRIAPAQWRMLQRKAAAVLIDAGLYDAAAELLQQSGDFDGLARLVLRCAKDIAASGRLTLLEQWIRALPDDWVETRPWLSYWLGICLLPFDRAQARACFARAYGHFKLDDEFNGRLLAWCGAVDSVVFEWGNFAPLDAWIDELETLADRIARESRPEVAAFVIVSAFVALMSRRPDHPDIARWADRAWEVAMHAQDPTLRAKIGPHLLIYFTWWIGDLAKAGLLLDALRPLMDRQHTAPLIQTAWCAMAAGYHWVVAENRTCIEVVEKGLAVATDSGVHAWDTLICAQGIFAALSSGDHELATHYLQRLAKDLASLQPLDRAMYYYLSAWQFLNRHQYESAREHAKTALDLAESAGSVFLAAIFQNDYGRALFYCGGETGARQAVLASQNTGRRIGAQSVEYVCFLVLAEMALVKGDDAACREALSACLAVGRRQAFRNHPWWNDDTMCRLYVKALEWGIEPEYVKRVIRLRRLAPSEPPVHLDAWPWPVRIYTLGRFSVVKNDVPLKFTTKAQKKPLELLKALIAFGGRDISQDKLAEALWPEAEGDFAYQNLRATLSRLRKLLGPEVLIVHEGKLSLDSRCCWVDLWAVERLMRTHVACDNSEDIQGLVKTAEKLKQLCHGPFLAGDENAIWAIPTRERLHNQYLCLINELGERLVEAGFCEQALACYHGGLDFDPLAEPLYRGLMRCYQRLGRPGEALTLYTYAVPRKAQNLPRYRTGARDRSPAPSDAHTINPALNPRRCGTGFHRQFVTDPSHPGWHPPIANQTRIRPSKCQIAAK